MAGRGATGKHPAVSKDLQTALGNRVRQHRQRLGLSQEALADKCGLHRTYVGGIERGERNPSLLNIGRLADALGVHIREMFPEPPADPPAAKKPA